MSEDIHTLQMLGKIRRLEYDRATMRGAAYFAFMTLNSDENTPAERSKEAIEKLATAYGETE